MWRRRPAPVPSADVGTRSRNIWWACAAALACLLLVASACSGDGGTTELSSDAADETTPGPLPTAPPTSAGSSSKVGSTGSVDVNELIRRIDALNNEGDLCTLLTGKALADVTGADVNLTSLLTNPSGFTQLFTSLDKLFAHMVTIGAPEVQPSLQTMQGVWKGLSTIDPRAPDAEARSGALIGDPKVQAAQNDLGAWVKANCTTTQTG
jgi:hypothetical protein